MTDKIIPNDHACMAQQLRECYRRGLDGIQSFILMGAILCKLRHMAAESPEDAAFEGGWHGWLERNTPEIPRATAHRMMMLAEQVRATCRLGARTDLVKLISAAPSELSENELRRKETLHGFLAGNSARKIMLGLHTVETMRAPKARTITPEEPHKEEEDIERKDALNAFLAATGKIFMLIDDQRHLVLARHEVERICDALLDARTALTKSLHS